MLPVLGFRPLALSLISICKQLPFSVCNVDFLCNHNGSCKTLPGSFCTPVVPGNNDHTQLPANPCDHHNEHSHHIYCRDDRHSAQEEHYYIEMRLRAARELPPGPE